MSLPIIESPKYEIVIPSTQTTVEVRPYLVKEEKILMLAMESADEKAMVRAMKDVISACSFGKLNPDDLTVVDLEYIFLKLRAVSVGETTTLQLKCQNEKCSQFVDVVLDLNSIEVPRVGQATISNRIELTDKIGVTMKTIVLKNLGRLKLEGLHKTEVITQLLGASIESVYDPVGVYRIEDEAPEAVQRFIDSLSTTQVGKIRDWLENQPILKKDVEYTCKKCSHASKITLRGLQAFFE